MARTLLKLFSLLIPCALAVVLAGGCASLQTSSPKQAKPRPADPKTQQRHYDLGLQLYSKEKYEDAREEFQQVVEINANNKLGIKAQENIRKINRILKTLDDMGKK